MQKDEKLLSEKLEFKLRNRFKTVETNESDVNLQKKVFVS